MDRINEKLHELLKKYGKDEEAVLCGNALSFRGKKTELLPWRKERRFIEMKNIVSSPYFNGLSMYRAMALEKKSADYVAATKRELDLFEYLTGDKTEEVFSVSNGLARNLLLKTKNGYVGVIELGFTLLKDGEETDKHEVISSSGIVCDKAIDTQYRQESVYVFGEYEKKYTDTDFELYGLNEKEAALVRQAFDVITGKDPTDYEKENKALGRLLNGVKKSEKESRNILMEEEE